MMAQFWSLAIDSYVLYQKHPYHYDIAPALVLPLPD